MRLYYAPGTIAVAAAITLHESGLPFDLQQVDFAAAEQTKPGYHVVNPKGRVPALETENGILTETGAILEYIAALAPQAGLVPTAPFAAARMREVMYYLASTMHVNHAHGMRGHRWAREESSFEDMRGKVAENMADCCAWLEENGIAGPFVLSETLSLADPYLYVVASWLAGDGVDPSAYPKLSTFMDAMGARDSVRAVHDLGML